MQHTQSYINANKEVFLEELLALLRIPSVSADPAYADDVRKTAQFVADKLQDVLWRDDTISLIFLTTRGRLWRGDDAFHLLIDKLAYMKDGDGIALNDELVSDRISVNVSVF